MANVDPTAGNRAAIGDWLSSIAPENSPFAQSSNQTVVSDKLNPIVQKLRDEELAQAQSVDGQKVSNATQEPIYVPSEREPASPSFMKPQAPTMPSSYAGSGKLAQAQNMALEGAALEAGAYDMQAKEAQSLDNKYEGRAAEQRYAQEQHMNNFMKKTQEVDDDLDSFKIDPNKMWDKMSTGNKVLAGLSIFLGVFDPSGQNKALGIIQSAIDRDVDSQKANYQKLLNKKQDLSTTYGYMMDKFKNEDMALAASKGAQYHALSLKVQAMAAQAKLPQVKAAYLEKAAAFDQKAAEMGQATMLKAQELAQKQVKGMVPGFEGVSMASEANTDKFREESANVKDIAKNIGEIKASVKSFNSLPGAEKEKIKTKIGLIVGDLKTQLLGPGPLSEGEREYMLNLVGDPTKFFSLDSSNTAKLDTILSSVIGKINNKATSYGLKATDPAYSIKTDLSQYKH